MRCSAAAIGSSAATALAGNEHVATADAEEQSAIETEGSYSCQSIPEAVRYLTNTQVLMEGYPQKVTPNAECAGTR